MTRDIGLLVTARSLRMFANGAVSLIMVLYLAGIGMDAAAIGLLLTLTLLGDTLVSLVLTTRADTWGRRKVLLLGGLLMAGASLVFVLTEDFLFLVVAATIGVISPSGGEVGPFLPVEQASLSHVLPDRSRTPAFGWYQVAGSISAAFGGLAGGFVVTLLKDAGYSELVGYRVVIGFSILVGLVLSGIFLLVSPAVEVERSEVRFGSRFGIHKSKGVVARLSALFVVDAFASGLIPMGLVLYWIHLRFGVEEAGLGGISFGFYLLTALSAGLSVWTARRIGLINTMVFTHLPANVMLMSIPFMPNVELAVAVILVRAVITQMDVPVRQSYTMAVVEPDERSAAAGITNTVRSLSQSIGPGLSTPMIVLPGLWTIPFLIGGVLKIGYDLALWKLFSSRPAPEERQTAEERAAGELRQRAEERGAGELQTAEERAAAEKRR